MSGPITPSEAQENFDASIPAEIYEAFNELIIINLSDGRATVRQDEVVKLAVKKGLNRSEIFDRSWLDIESHYRKAGWKVDYDKPAYNEDYPATFTFSKRKR